MPERALVEWQEKTPVKTAEGITYCWHLVSTDKKDGGKVINTCIIGPASNGYFELADENGIFGRRYSLKELEMIRHWFPLPSDYAKRWNEARSLRGNIYEPEPQAKILLKGDITDGLVLGLLKLHP